MSGVSVEADVPGRLVASARLDAGAVVGVIGPNGAGKTTLLNAVAGTLDSGQARVVVGGSDWSAQPPQARSVGMVHQNHRLFPHLSAQENVAFGPRARGRSRAQANAVAQDWLERMAVGDLAARRPGQLSGGEAQRVAIARALATDPQVLLLDEAFAALDVGVAADLRVTLAEHLAAYDGVVLMATHDPLDLAALTDTVLVLDHGRLAQSASTAAVAEAPATPHAARMLGLNVLSGQAHGVRVDLGEGAQVITAEPREGRVVVTFPPNAVALSLSAGTGSPRNQWPGTVRSVAERAQTVRVLLHAGSLDLFVDVTRTAAIELGLEPGLRLWASVKATELTVLQ